MHCDILTIRQHQQHQAINQKARNERRQSDERSTSKESSIITKNTRGKLFRTNSAIGSIKREDSIVQLCTCWCLRRFNIFWPCTITYRDKHELHTLCDPLFKRISVTHRQLLTTFHSSCAERRWAALSTFGRTCNFHLQVPSQ